MAYTIARITGTNYWEEWDADQFSGNIWAVAKITGASSGATGWAMRYTWDLAITLNKVFLIRLTATNFTVNETVNIAGGGSFRVTNRDSQATHPLVYVTGSDTINVFQAIADASVSGGWGYHTNSVYGRCVLDCSVLIGTPDQTAVTSAVSKKESVDINGSWWVGGNSTYESTFAIGDGTYGDVETSVDGSIITCDDTAICEWSGSTRYGLVKAHASGFNRYSGAWATQMQRCECYLETTEFGGHSAFLVSAWDSDSGDKWELTDNSVSDAFYIGHSQAEITKLTVGDDNNGIVATGDGTWVLNEVAVKNTLVNSIFGWVCIGTINFVDCDIDESDVDGFWSDYDTNHKYSVDIKVTNEDGDAVSGAKVRCWDDSQDPLSDTPLFDVTTAGSGSITTQEVLYATNGDPAPYVNNRPITFLITKVGWVEDCWESAFTDGPYNWIRTLKSVDKDAMTE